MSAFTPVASADVQDIAFWNEIILGIRERQQAVRVSPAIPLLTGGEDLQAASRIMDMQNAIDALIDKYVDHTIATATGGWEGYADIQVFSTSSFRSAAGLHSSGWRRVPKGTDWDPAVNDWTDLGDPMYSYGTHQAGDIILAPWIFDDLQKALSALKQTSQSENVPTTKWTRDQIIDSVNFQPAKTTCSDAYATLIWPGLPWNTLSDGGNVYWALGSVCEFAPSDWRGAVTRLRSKPKVPIATTAVPCSCDVYFRLDTPPDTADWSGWQFIDVDGYGVASGELVYHESLPAASDATRQAATYVGDFSTDPLAVMGVFCPGGAGKGAWAAAVRFLCHWQFSHSN